MYSHLTEPGRNGLLGTTAIAGMIAAFSASPVHAADVWTGTPGGLDTWVRHGLPLVMAYSSALAALADPTRRNVFERLRTGPLPVNALAAGLSVSRPAVSQHLKVLKGAGLVKERSEGVRRIYSLRREGLMELRDWLDTFWDGALAAFKEEVEKADGVVE
jgi:DNA-binding transcriptional ArsR family regulator